MFMKRLENINNWKNKSLYIVSASYVFIAITLGFILNNGLVIFLGWNMILATIPLLLTHFYPYQKSKFLRLGIAFLYILFFPNSIYIMTDFIHFQEYTYFLDYPNIYAYLIEDWIIFVHVVIGALISSKIGMRSLDILSNELTNIRPHVKNLLIHTLFLLSSIAIFIGRFIRFNSWQFYKINLMIKDILSHFQFFIFFVLLMFIMHWVIYFVFHEKKEPMAHIK